MASYLLDIDEILATNEQWRRLEEQWGKPVDLDTEEDFMPSTSKPLCDTLDLKRTTFNSSHLFKIKKTKKVNRKPTKIPSLDYADFIEDLEQFDPSDQPAKQFYYVGGQVLSAASVENICEEIDEIFKSAEIFCCTTSTIRCKEKPGKRKRVIPSFVERSISYDGLSFDDTIVSEKVEENKDGLDSFIDEAFGQIDCTISNSIIV
ncbi:uncharacterized protein LOC131841018 [Achroia grisella]|uniref:uncharacterized protein LOC131841018 n=1 Tax=Achroia grisella TaxID=688607 RepID=UPI0027D266B5|nr:uncharacterized protein LOC131841018 [Achroia grisella]